MAADGSAPSESFFLLQPELMTIETLIQTLSLRCVSMETMRDMTKESLIELYRRVALPLPQRECYRYAREKVGSTAMLLEEGKRSNFTVGFNGSVVNSTCISRTTVRSGNADRLRPPVEHVNKKIRLSSSKSDSLDNIVINNRQRNRNSTEHKTDSTSIIKQDTDKNGSNSESKIFVEDSKSSEPKKPIALKRNFNSQGQNVNKETEGSPTEKKLRSKITWP